jgi:hypothetical protein
LTGDGKFSVVGMDTRLRSNDVEMSPDYNALDGMTVVENWYSFSRTLIGER